MFVLLVLIGFVTALLAFYKNEYSKRNRYLDNFPGPPYIPLFGSALAFCKPTELLNQLLQYFYKYKGSFVVRLGPIRPVVFVTDQKTLEFMLTSTKYLDKSLEYKFGKNWLKNGILVSTGNYWRKHRKIITPAFHFSILETFVQTYDKQAITLTQKLKKEIDGSSFDLYPYVTLCSLDIISETSMGAAVNAQDDASSEYVRCVREILRIVLQRSFSPILMYDTLYEFTPTRRREKQVLKVLHGHTKQVIQRRKQMLQGKKLDAVDEFGNKNRYALLDLLLSKGKDGEQVLTDAEIEEEVDTLMFEGHDTTTTAIVFSLYCIANHPYVQQRLVEELKEVYADDFLRATTQKDLQKLVYLEMIIKEAIRLYPSVPFYNRELPEDVEIGDQIYPKGCTIAFFAYAIQRDPKNFPNPEQFDPSRFTPGTTLKPYSYLPFSAGSRNCIGQKFAMEELKTVISRVVRQYELSPAVPKHELALTLEGVLKSATGVHIQIKERKV